MYVSSPVYPVIIGNVPGARRMLPDPDGGLKTSREFEPGPVGQQDKDNEDNQDGDIPTGMFEKSNQEETKKSAPKKRNSKKKPVQPKENDNRARWSVKGGAIEEECVAGPVCVEGSG